MANFDSSRAEMAKVLAQGIKVKEISFSDFQNIEIDDIEGIKSAIEDDE
jgi:hypothetical protein